MARGWCSFPAYPVRFAMALEAHRTKVGAPEKAMAACHADNALTAPFDSLGTMVSSGAGLHYARGVFFGQNAIDDY